MGQVLSYKKELSKAMAMLAEETATIFIGQGVVHPDVTPMFDTLYGIPLSKRIELPVMENTQMGMSIGLALQGYLPVSIYPRMDFLLLAFDQLINHLDKFEELSHGEFNPKVIIRTSVGAIKPLNPGPQHCQNHTGMLIEGLTNIDVMELTKPEHIVPAYLVALNSPRSTVLVELAEMMN